MSGETDAQPSSWTPDLLHLHLQRQLDDMRELLNERYATQTEAIQVSFTAAEKAVQTALSSAEKAVTKAEIAAEKRFEAVNEFRAQLSDQAATFPSRNEVDTRITAMGDKVAGLASRLDKIEGNTSGSSDQTTRIIAGILAAVAVISLLITIYVATKG